MVVVPSQNTSTGPEREFFPMTTNVVQEIAARRAVEGVDEMVLRAGGSPAQADAIALAFRLFLLGEKKQAGSVLCGAFPTEIADLILAQFAQPRRAA